MTFLKSVQKKYDNKTYTYQSEYHFYFVHLNTKPFPVISCTTMRYQGFVSRKEYISLFAFYLLTTFMQNRRMATNILLDVIFFPRFRLYAAERIRILVQVRYTYVGRYLHLNSRYVVSGGILCVFFVRAVYLQTYLHGYLRLFVYMECRLLGRQLGSEFSPFFFQNKSTKTNLPTELRE